MPLFKEQHLFYAELAKLLEAGFDIRKAAAVMQETRLPTWQASWLEMMVKGLDDRKTIAQAIGSHPKVSELERSIIHAGERGGRLAQAFRHLSDYFALIAGLRAEAIRSMIYPLFVLHLGLVVAVIPTGLMKGKPADELLVSLVLVVGAVYLVGAILVGLVILLLKAAPRNAAIDRSLNRIPLVGKARRSMAMARFARVYHTCVLAGMSPSESLEIAANSAQSGELHQATAPLITTATDGNQVGPAMIAGRGFPAAFARSYATAEESGSLDVDMGRWSKAYQEEAETAARAVSATLPKVLYFMILAFVAWQIVSFFTGYYEMLDTIGE